jgi:hypothetical protein
MKMNEILPPYTAFNGQTLIANGDLETVVRGSKTVLDQTPHASLLIFDNTDSRQVEIDFRGSLEDVLSRLPAPNPEAKTAEENTEVVKAGRPKLGVVAREVTLLPRHWEWLAAQPGGASVSLRKLVEEARRTSQTKDRTRQTQESINRFLTVMAGNFPGFEEATRTLYRGEKERFEVIIADWPHDVVEHLKMLGQNGAWEVG